MGSITITMQESFAPLTSPKALEIMASLSKCNKLLITEIQLIVGGSARTTGGRVEELEAAGLIKEKKATEFPFRRWISLTKKGELVAMHLLSIEEILGIQCEPFVKKEG